MSELTLMDLQTIAISLEWTFPSKQTANMGIVEKKIKSMIDNYCDHERQKCAYVYADVCEKCNAVLRQASDL